jgi:hypothetical protein
MRRILTAVALSLACGLLPNSASALDIGGMDLRIGARGGAAVSYMGKPRDLDLYGSTAYANYMGLGWTFGAVMNFRLFGVVGIEAGWMRTLETAQGSIELRDVRQCQPDGSGPCQRQEFDQEFERTIDRIPLTLQLALPTGLARPFLNLGVDLVVNQTNRNYAVVGRDPLPADLADDDPRLEQWEASYVGQNALRASLNPDVNEAYTGIIAGIGVDIQIKSVAIPIEFRANIYPSAGATIPQRGRFGDPCVVPDPLTGEIENQAAPVCTVGPNTPPQLYNDRWPMQFMILFGIDYRIL